MSRKGKRAFDRNGWQVCRDCLKPKEDQYNAWCRLCRAVRKLPGTQYKRHTEKHKAQMRAHYAANKEIYKRRARNCRLRRKYGLSPEEYERIALAQDNRCAICSKEGAITRGGIRLAVDHCHSTGKLRELLCFNCNAMLGQANDEIGILKQAIAYLEKHGKRSA